MKFSEKNLLALCKHPLFSQCDRQSLSRLLTDTDCFVQKIPCGEEICSPDRTAQKAVGMILLGKASVTTPNQTKNVLLRYLNQGDLFGIANLFSTTPYVSVIRATVECKVFYLTDVAIRQLLETDRAFLYRYLDFLSGRICFLNQKIGYLTAGSSERRLALYLASLGENPITLPLSISSLSELLDVGRASLYRAFDRLTADGYLRKEGRVFYLSDPQKMLLAYR